MVAKKVYTKNTTLKYKNKQYNKYKVGENLTNALFKRADFPSINIGKTKSITAIAYALWKLEKVQLTFHS